MFRFKRDFFAIAFAVSQVAVVGWLDYITSYEISLAVIYYIPIAYAAWSLGWGWSFGISVLCAVTLISAEVASGERYSHQWIIWERAFMGFLAFLFVAFSFNYFRRTIERERQKVRRLEAMFTFCTCCHKVRDEGGNWTDLDSFLRENKAVESEAKLCPTCAREVYATGGVRKTDDG